MKFVSFDIEIAKVLPEDAGNWDAYYPLGISCAATMRTGDEKPELWYGGEWRDPAPQMTRHRCQMLVKHLMRQHQQGYLPLTWNGLSFDFRVLAEESGMFQECKQLALDHVDMMFHFFCLRGFTVGLDAACKGMGLSGKPRGMTGALAPVMWAEGKYQEVLDYVAGDVIQPLRLAEMVENAGMMTWLTKRGALADVTISEWMVARDALALELPDTGWMDDPWPRSKFTSWLERNTDGEAEAE